MNEDMSKRKHPLRKLRNGIEIRFNGYDHDGIPNWLIFDPSRNKYFLIGWPEYEMLSRWKLGDPNLIITAVNQETTLNLSLKDFESLESFLYRNQLVEQRWRSVYQRAREQKVIKGENIFYWFIRYYLFFRIPLFNPDPFLNRTKPFGRFIFSRPVLYCMIFLGMVALYQISLNWDIFVTTFSKIFTWQGLFLYFLVFTGVKFCHEFGHAYMCKQYNVSVPTMGVAFLVFWPVLYTDTTQSWSLPSQQRIRIALAGMWVETYLTIFAALIWANVHDITLQMICYITVAINWVSTLLINVSPFMRFDGYYVLSDLLKMPNLQNRSFTLARWQIRQWLFGWNEPPPEEFSDRMHFILLSYAFVTIIYRLFIYFAIALLVYHYFFKMLGILLFLIEVFAFILRPLSNEVQVWYHHREKFKFNVRIIATVVVVFVLFILFLLPLNAGIKIHATIGYKHELLYIDQDATLLSEKPLPESPVKKDQIIAELDSPELDNNLNKINLEIQKILDQIRQASFDPNYANDLSNLNASLNEKQTEQNRLQGLRNKLLLRAPFDGIISEINPNISKGSTVMKNIWIMNIIDPTVALVEGFVNQSDLGDIKVNDTGYFYPLNLSEPAIPVTVSAIEKLNVTELSWRFSKGNYKFIKSSSNVNIIAATPSYHASELGGKIPTQQSETGEYIPVESTFRILMVPEKKPEDLHHIELGTVFLARKERSLGSAWGYKLKKVLMKESGF